MSVTSSITAIVNATPFYRDRDGVWLPADEWKSLSQWAEIFGNVTLLKPELYSAEVPPAFMRIPDGIKVQTICRCDDPFWRRRASVTAAAQKAARFDLLYTRMPSYEATWFHRAVAHRGIPLLVELHGDWETAILEEDVRNAIRVLTRRYRARSARNAVRAMCRRAACVVSIGPALIRKYVPEGVPALTSTNHLLEERCYSRRTDYALQDPPRLLFVGAMQRRKGLHVLFQSLASLKRQGRRFRMTLVGSGPQVEPLKAFAREHGFDGSVVFAGYFAHGPEIFQYFKEADVFILPSIASEGVPRVTHEAMALGCPVIATDVGSTAWQLRDGAGIVVPPANAEMLSRAIARILDDGELRRTVAERGHARSLEHTLEKQKAAIAAFVRLHLASRCAAFSTFGGKPGDKGVT